MNHSFNQFDERPPVKPMTPLFIGIALALGVVIGYYLNNQHVGGRLNKSGSAATSTGEKISSVVNYIQEQYVDTVNPKELEEKTLTALLHSMDPHSD